MARRRLFRADPTPSTMDHGSPRAPSPGGGGPESTGTLYVVATPIGNLEDITLRALRILGEVDVVAAEDTRRTSNLLRHYRIETPLISLHEHNEHHRSAQVIERLRTGQSVALVSDAGTPGIADPGAHVVRAAREAGIRVDPIPGASAVTATLGASGFASDRFAFAGFPPVRSKDRARWFDWVRELSDVPVLFFEAPHRIQRTLAECRLEFVKRPILLARELTKAHEEWLDGSVEPLERGEFVIIIGPLTENDRADTGSGSSESAEHRFTDGEIQSEFGRLTNSVTYRTRRDAIRALAERLELPTRAVYEALERAKN